MANTLKELEEMSVEMLKPADIAGVLGTAAHTIRVAAHQMGLPFPYIILGNRVKIPRRPFIEWMKTGNVTIQEGQPLSVVPWLQG